LLFAMSDQRQLPAALARVHARFHTPILAIALTAGTAWVLALSGSFIYLVKLTLITRVTVYAITCAMLGIFRRASHAPEPSFKVPAGEAVAYGTAVLCILFLASSSMRELLDVAIAAAIGLVVFGVTRFRLARAGADLHRI
jgi:basic amino acid/polyamine antiporter, APA family